MEVDPCLMSGHDTHGMGIRLNTMDPPVVHTNMGTPFTSHGSGVVFHRLWKERAKEMDEQLVIDCMVGDRLLSPLYLLPIGWLESWSVGRGGLVLLDPHKHWQGR